MGQPPQPRPAPPPLPVPGLVSAPAAGRACCGRPVRDTSSSACPSYANGAFGPGRLSAHGRTRRTDQKPHLSDARGTLQLPRSSLCNVSMFQLPANTKPPRILHASGAWPRARALLRHCCARAHPRALALPSAQPQAVEAGRMAVCIHTNSHIPEPHPLCNHSSRYLQSNWAL
jgi:hypothetical protein